MCARCRNQGSASERGLCVPCAFALRAEIEDGLDRLGDYLRRWADYADWCERRGLAA